MDVRVGHLPDPYRLDGARAGGQPVWTVEKIVMNEPDPDRLGPYIRPTLKKTFTGDLREPDSGGRAVAEC